MPQQSKEIFLYQQVNIYELIIVQIKLLFKIRNMIDSIVRDEIIREMIQ